MGKPGPQGSPWTEYIGPQERTRRTETSQYPQEKKEKSIASVAASERATAQTLEVFLRRVVGPLNAKIAVSRIRQESGTIEGDSPVRENQPI